MAAIELRHAPFMLWITDLSAKDPLYVTPVLMTATMWLQQRLAPAAGDPQQQRIMRMMPLDELRTGDDLTADERRRIVEIIADQELV